MPFSFMEENTVFLIIIMICKNIYTYLICKFAEVFTDLKKNFRIKKFIFRFIILPVKWVKHSRYNILKIFSTKPYDKLKLLQKKNTEEVYLFGNKISHLTFRYLRCLFSEIDI